MNGRAADRFRILCTAVAAALAFCAFAAGEDLQSLEQEAMIAAVDRVAPSVVRIETVGGMERVGGMLLGTGPTTGLLLDAEGYVVSSEFNFLSRPTSILVGLPDGRRKPARLVATDHARGIVLLRIDADGPLPVPEIAPQSSMRVGQWTIAVGRAFDADRPSMTVGILSALGRVWGKAVQTDAIVSPNNYGGPLIDVHGRVLGLIVPLSPQAEEEFAGVEWYDSGIGFAVPAEHIRNILPRLKSGEDLYPAMAGFSLRGPNIYTAEPILAACRPDSPAAKAGLKPGDRIVEIDGREIRRAAEVKEEIGRRYAGAKMRLAVLRDGKRSEHELELARQLKPQAVVGSG